MGLFLRLVFGLVALLALAGAGLWVNWQMAVPSHDRDWRADHAGLPRVIGEGDLVTVENVRDFDYSEAGEIVTEDWISAAIDVDALEQAYFLVEPFGDNEAIAHTMLAFAFEDGAAYVVSVEARREVGEVYSAPKAAVLPVFEYLFVWATERDMYANTVFWSDGTLYRYPLEIDLDAQKAVLRRMIEETRALEAEARWYNTLWSNCTNVLARAVNRIRPDAVPWNKAWILPGYSDDFLHGLGMIGSGLTLEETVAAGEIGSLVPLAHAETDPAAFSRRLSELQAAR